MYLNYITHFGENDLAKLAQSTYKFFHNFLRKTFSDLVLLGDKLLSVKEECLKQGEEGEKKFAQWLLSAEFGGSSYIAEAAMILAPWYHQLPKSLQRLARNKINHWSPAALRHLPKLKETDLEQTIISGKKTEKQIKALIPEPKKFLTPGKLVQEQDLNLVANKFDIPVESIVESIKEKFVKPLSETTTEDLVEVIGDFGKNAQLVLPKNKKAKEPKTEAPIIAQPQELFTMAQVQEMVAEALSLKKEALYTEEQMRQQVKEALDNFQKADKEIRSRLEAENDQLKQELAFKSAMETENQRLREEIASLKNQENPTQGTLINHLEVRNTELETELIETRKEVNIYKQKLQKYAYLEVPLSDDLLYVGAIVKVLGDDPWKGYPGTVTSKDAYGNWWVHLDYIKEQGSESKNCYKATQLAFCLNLSTQSNHQSDDNKSTKQAPMEEQKNNAAEMAAHAY